MTSKRYCSGSPSSFWFPSWSRRRASINRCCRYRNWPNRKKRKSQKSKKDSTRKTTGSCRRFTNSTRNSLCGSSTARMSDWRKTFRNWFSQTAKSRESTGSWRGNTKWLMWWADIFWPRRSTCAKISKCSSGTISKRRRKSEIDKEAIINYESQSLSWESIAVPLNVQNSGFSCLDGRSMYKMKFVDWPVVDSTPTRFEVL